MKHLSNNSKRLAYQCANSTPLLMRFVSFSHSCKKEKKRKKEKRKSSTGDRPLVVRLNKLRYLLHTFSWHCKKNVPEILRKQLRKVHIIEEFDEIDRV